MSCRSVAGKGVALHQQSLMIAWGAQDCPVDRRFGRRRETTKMDPSAFAAGWRANRPRKMLFKTDLGGQESTGNSALQQATLPSSTEIIAKVVG